MLSLSSAVVVVTALFASADDPFAGCKPDPSSLDLVLDCGDIALTVEEEVGGDAHAMLQKHLGGVREDVPGAEVDEAGAGDHATYRHNDVVGTVDAQRLADVTRVVSCGGPAPVANERCPALLTALMKKGSSVSSSFFRARDVEKAWLLPPPTKDCRVRRTNLVLDLDCDAFGFTVAKADVDAKKREASIRRMVSEMERSAGANSSIHSAEDCKLHGAPATCLRAEIKGVHVVVAAGVVNEEPLQARCDWEGAPALPPLCANHIVVAP